MPCQADALAARPVPTPQCAGRLAFWSFDRVQRQFHADRPGQLSVSNFTYGSTWQGWLYVAFVIEVLARRIVGWRVSTSLKTYFVLDAFEQALHVRQPLRIGGLIHHSDRGSQYVSIRLHRATGRSRHRALDRQ